MWNCPLQVRHVVVGLATQLALWGPSMNPGFQLCYSGSVEVS